MGLMSFVSVTQIVFLFQNVTALVNINFGCFCYVIVVQLSNQKL